MPAPHPGDLKCGAGRPRYRFAPELTGTETYQRGVAAMSNSRARGAAFFFVHGATDLPKRSTIIGAVSNDQAADGDASVDPADGCPVRV